MEKFKKNVLALDNLVNYQKDSIVSREIIKKETGTITLFAFDAAQGLSEHTVPFDAMVNILDGEARITIGKKQFRVRAGEMIIMPANEPHRVNAEKRFKMLLVLIKK
ncbi:MAG: cupin domain-containing protein [bacterium]|nr:cupin domain-containing protein [bacterium]